MSLRLHNPVLPDTVRAVSSKSWLHRALICSALADGPVSIGYNKAGDDVACTVNGLRNIGAAISADEDIFSVNCMTPARFAEIICADSGSTFRFLLPLISALGLPASFLLSERLSVRPHKDLLSALSAHGCNITVNGRKCLCSGRLSPGRFNLTGNVSSQFISGLLMALPLLEGDSRIYFPDRQVSFPYINLTLDVLSLFQITVTRENNTFLVPGNQKFVSPGRLYAEGDWSSAAFFLCAAAASGKPITVFGLSSDSAQGDRIITEVLKEYGAQLIVSNDSVSVAGGTLSGVHFHASDTPDLVPPLALAAACAQGESVFTGLSALRLKESDRIKSIVSAIRSLGGSVYECTDSLHFAGGGLSGGEVDSFNDHRIAMLAAAAAAACGADVVIHHPECVSKSYPDFYFNFL